MFESEEPKVGRIYRVRQRQGTAADPAPKPRLIRAKRHNQVEGLILQDYEIELAKPDECVALGAAGVKIEDAPAT